MRIYVIDDEPRQRRGLENLLRSMESTAEIMSFNNGMQAVDAMKDTPADVVFSDIRMPHMTGLELAEKIHLTHPAAIIVLISAYAEFDYAQKAISLGAFEYLLKPISVEKVQLVLNRIHQTLSNRDVKGEADEKTENVWSSLADPEKTVDRQALSDLLNNRNSGCFLQIYTNDLSDYFSQDLAEIGNNIGSWFRHYIPNAEVRVLKTDNQEFLMYAFVFQEQELVKLIEAFRDVILQEYHVSLSISCTGWLTDLVNMTDQLRCQMKHLQDMRFFRAGDAILFYNDYKPMKSDVPYCGDETFSTLVQTIFCGDIHQTDDMTEKILNDYISRNVTPYCFAVACIHLLMKIDETIGDQEEYPDWKPFASVADRIHNACSAIQIRLIILEIMELVCRQMANSRTGSKPIKKVMEFVSAHYAERITLNDAAKLCHYSVSYFSRVFKAQTGENFVSYLNKVRLNHTVSRMATSSSDITQIAYSCGFNDINYYTRLFKREYHMTPQTYRDKLARSEEQP